MKNGRPRNMIMSSFGNGKRKYIFAELDMVGNVNMTRWNVVTIIAFMIKSTAKKNKDLRTHVQFVTIKMVQIRPRC